MTITGEEIVACPKCSNLYKNPIIASYNTFNVTRYSDGYMEGVLPNFISVVKCFNTNCNSFFHIKDADVVGKILYDKSKDSQSDKWKNAISLHDYQRENLFPSQGRRR